MSKLETEQINLQDLIDKSAEEVVKLFCLNLPNTEYLQTFAYNMVAE